MAPQRTSGYLLVAATALAFGFLLAAQLRTQLLVPTNQVARDTALVRSVQELERINAGDRARVAALRQQIADLEAAAARRSEGAQRLNLEVQDLRAHAGLTPLKGPGVTVELADGRPGSDLSGQSGYRVNFQDVQDVVNALYAGGAEGVAVNGHRVTPASSFAGSAASVVIDQSEPLTSPFRVVAVGNRNQMEQLLAQPSVLGDLRNRGRRYGVGLTVTGAPDLSLPSADSSLSPRYAQAA